MGTKIACRSQEEHRSSWGLLDRDWIRFGDDLVGRATPGIHTVACPVCRVAWRSDALYARGLPTAPRGFAETNVWHVCNRYPLLAELTYHTEYAALAGRDWPSASVPFLHDVGVRLTTYGKITERQRDAVIGVIERKIAQANERQAVQAAKQAEYEAQRERAQASRAALGLSTRTEPPPAGRHVVRGVVVASWLQEHDGTDPPTWRMDLDADDGYAVTVTVPAVLRAVSTLEGLVGRRIELHVELRPRPGPWASAWGAYPGKNSRFIDQEDQ